MTAEHEAAGPAELHPFNIRVRDKRERWEEAVKLPGLPWKLKTKRA